jgi:hypothetical protein
MFFLRQVAAGTFLEYGRMSYVTELGYLSDEALFGKVEALAETERFCLVDLLLHLGELDQRGACQSRGYSSMFAYLTRHLGYSESDAVRRVRAARAVRKYPSILRMLANGELNVVGVAMLWPVLTSDNHERMLRKAVRRSTRELERMVADLLPATAEPRDQVRALPPVTVESVGPSLQPELAAAVAPVLSRPEQAELVAPAISGRGRVLFSFAAGERFQSRFEEARDLLRHKFPMGRMEEILGEALESFLEGKSHQGQVGRDRNLTVETAGRHIPKWVRDLVWRRDSGRCAFKGPDGMRCGETSWLEWDHIVPWALGGSSNDPANTGCYAARIISPRPSVCSGSWIIR